MQPKTATSTPPLVNLLPPSMPLQERVLVGLAEVLVGADDVLQMLKEEGAGELRWVEPHVRGVYAAVDGIMSKLSQ